jgi:PAS domain S-box-containing protein
MIDSKLQKQTAGPGRSDESKTPAHEGPAELAGANQALRAEVAAGKRVEEELRQERDFTSAVLETMDALVVVLDRRGRIIRFNRACERTTGYSFEEVRGKEIWPLLIAADEAAMVRPIFDGLLAGHIPNQFENDWLTRDGRRRRIAWCNTAMVGKSGAVEHIIGTGIDVTSRKQAEEALQSAEQRLELAVGAARMGIFDHDVETGRVIASDDLARLFGLTPDQFGGTFDSFLQRVHPEDRAGIAAKIRQAHATRTDHTIEYRVIWPDGSIHWLEGRARLLAAPGRALGTVIDITKRKIAEEQLLNHRQRLRSLASQLSVTEERERRRIAMDLHDSIGQNLALALLKLGGKPESAPVSRAGRELELARRLIEEALSSIHSLSYELSPPILHDLGLEAALEWLSEQFQDRHGLQVTFSDDGEPKPVAEELRFLLFRSARELLVNVVKHAAARTAKLCVCRRGHDLELSVEDDGKGFATLPTIVAGASPDASHGFGLFSIRERVEHFGGRFQISSLPGTRTRACVTVPLQSSPGIDRSVDYDRSAP